MTKTPDTSQRTEHRPSRGREGWSAREIEPLRGDGEEEKTDVGSHLKEGTDSPTDYKFALEIER